MTPSPEDSGQDSKVRAEVERFLDLVREDPALRAELESLSPQFVWPEDEQEPVRLPDIEPFTGLQTPSLALLTFMKHWSEELRAAQWYGDLEYFLATLTTGAGSSAAVVPKGFQAAYRLLVDQAGGWFTYGPEGQDFVPGSYEQLVERAARWSSQQNTQGKR